MKDKKFITSIFIAIFALLLFMTSLKSTTTIELSLKEMCEKSSDIVIAKTISVNSYQTSDQKHIYTDFKLEVIENIKGRFQQKDILKLTLYGGTFNGITAIVFGDPRFSVDEQSMLFLSERQSIKTGQNYLIVVGTSQGKFNIITDPITNAKMVIREQVNIPLQIEKDGGKLPLTNTTPMSLDDFLIHISQYLNP